MLVPKTKSNWVAFAVTTIALFAIIAVSAISSATADAAMRVDSAVAVGNGAVGAKATCASAAKRKARRFAAGASTSSRTTKRVRRTKAAFQRRCMARLRRAKHRQAQPSTATPNPGPLVVGIDGGYSGWWSEEVELRTELNAAVTRHQWDTDESVDAQDDFVLEASAVDTRVHAVIGGNELGDATHYKEWTIAFIRRYGVGGSFWSEHPNLDASKYAITTFELGNEPYFGGMTATEYANTVRPALEAVKQLGLPAKLIVPSYIYGTDTHWIDTLYQQIPDLNSLFYAFADHPYWYGHAPSQTGDGNSPFTRIETLRKKMAEHGAGSKPLFLTEYGESTANCGSECVSESAQADHIREMIEAVVNHPEWGVEMLDLFQLHDWATGSSDREQQFGLLREDGTPKPAYAIARAAMQRYRG